MQKKILSVLLALAMIAGLFVAIIPEASAETIANSAGGKDYIYYVSASGSKNNDGLTPETSFYGIITAVAKIKALSLTANDNVIIRIIGAVGEAASPSSVNNLPAYNSQCFFNGVSDDRLPCPVTFEGVDGTDPTLLFLQSGTYNASCRRYTGSWDLVFKNLTIATADYVSATKNAISSFKILFGSASNSMTFDGVTFASRPWKSGLLSEDTYNALSDVEWVLSPNWIREANYSSAPQVLALKKTSSNYGKTTTVNIYNELVFLNGDYTNVDVAALNNFTNGNENSRNYAGTAYTFSAAGKTYTVDTNASGKELKAKVASHPRLVIGEGAVMGTISAVNWARAAYSSATLVVEAGAKVENVYAYGPDALNPNSASQMKFNAYVIVDPEAEVENLDTFAPAASDDYDSYETASVTYKPTACVSKDGKYYENGVLRYDASVSNKVELYVAEDGSSSNDGLSEETPFLYVRDAYNLTERMNHCGFLHGLDSVHFYLSGQCKEAASYPGQSTLSNGLTLELYPVPLIVEGIDANAAFVIMTNDIGNASTRRYVTQNTTFRNLTMTGAGSVTSGSGYFITLTANTEDLTFDGVVFDDGINWRVSATTIVGGGFAIATNSGMYDSRNPDYSPENPYECTPTVTFKNGDYSNLDAVSAMGVPGVSGSDGMGTVSIAYQNYAEQVEFTPAVVIGDGAVMGTVYGAYGSGRITNASVTVEEGGWVETLYAITPNYDLRASNKGDNERLDIRYAEGTCGEVILPETIDEYKFDGAIIVNGATVDVTNGAGISFVISSKLELLMYLPKAEVDAVWEDFFYAVRVGSGPNAEKIASGTAADLDYDEETGCYVAPISGININRFGSTIHVYGVGLLHQATTVKRIAQNAKAAWAEDEALANLAQSIIDLADNNDVAAPVPETRPVISNDESVMKGYGLYFNDAVGLYLNLNPDSGYDLAALNISVDGEMIVEEGEVVGNLCRYNASTGKLIIFVHAGYLQTWKLDIVINDGFSDVASFSATVSEIAAAYLDVYAENETTDGIQAYNDAKALLKYADAVFAVKNA